MISSQNKVATCVIITGLLFVTSLSFADGFGVSGNQNIAASATDNPAGSINQLLGNTQAPPPQPTGTLNPLQIKQILYHQHSCKPSKRQALYLWQVRYLQHQRLHPHRQRLLCQPMIPLVIPA